MASIKLLLNDLHSLLHVIKSSSLFVSFILNLIWRCTNKVVNLVTLLLKMTYKIVNIVTNLLKKGFKLV